MKKTLAVFAVLVALPLLAVAGEPLTIADTVLGKARIEAIDHDVRELTLVDEGGGSANLRFGPEIEGFEQLKVGDSVTLRYYETVAYAIRRPDQPSTPPSRTGEPVVERGRGPNPGATLSRQQTATLTIVGVDAKAPSLTALTEDGRRLSFRPFREEDVARLEIGDLIDVTYTQALVIGVVPSPASGLELVTALAPLGRP
jgi:hypothetical protein